MTTKSVLNVIICSTRPGRVCPIIADWFYRRAVENAHFDVRLIDLADFRLPVFDEPNHPRLGQYMHEHTKAWSASVASADAFVFVMPEYNSGPTPALLNAIDYLHAEWQYKPASFVSYGGISGGAKGVQLTSIVLKSLKVVSISEAVAIPFFREHICDNTFLPSERVETSAKAMLSELYRWARALMPMRA
jgi:NAD(P)H-dependent FMN reductase